MDVTREVLIRNRSGLHARPAAQFVSLARTFASDLTIECRGQTASCKSILSLLKLGIGRDSEVRIQASGADAEMAMSGLLELLERLVADEGKAS